ncbi:hypothetical protein ACH4CD_26230 [Streptomyces fungicidicus]
MLSNHMNPWKPCISTYVHHQTRLVHYAVVTPSPYPHPPDGYPDNGPGTA